MSKATTKQLARLNYLAAMIAKYAHRWGEDTSARLMGWVDEANDITQDMKRQHTAEWEAYCERTGTDTSTNGYDYLA